MVAVSRSEKELNKLLEEYGSDRVQIVVGDVAKAETSTTAVKLAVEKFGQVNSIIANAGVLDPVDQVAKADVAGWKELFDINFFAVVDLVQKAIPELRKTKGNIVAVLSGASTSAYNGWGAYGASKAALNHFILSVASEESDIHAISVAPGVVDTSMQNDIRNKFGKNMTKESLKRFVDLHKNSELLPPEVPATCYVNLALNGWDTELNGKYLRINDEALKSYLQWYSMIYNERILKLFALL